MLQEAFDSYAGQYDAHFTFSEIGKLQRKRVWKFLRKFLDGKKIILELNCGTGADACKMAAQGHQVTATDISEEMIAVAASKSSGGNPQFIRCDARDISQCGLREQHVVFSNFGGLNCLDKQSLLKLSEDLALLSAENAVFCAVIMGNNCSWENFYFKKIKNPLAGRRRSVQTATINGVSFPVWYYSPEEFSGLFGKHFSPVLIRPVGLFIPPSYLNYYFSKKPVLLKLLNIAETIFGNSRTMASYSDHYFIALKRKGT